MTKRIPDFYQRNRIKQMVDVPKIVESQMPKWIRDIVDEQVDEFNGSIEVVDAATIPHTDDIPLLGARWLKIPDVICVFADMKGSTQLSATIHDKSTARAYQLFTGTAVKIFDAFDAPYIDVKGDGVFALFNNNQPYRALAAAVSFKTFADEVFTKTVNSVTRLNVGSHIGIDQKGVLVRKLGLKRIEGRTDRQNEVWAGKPVNMASKLASRGENAQLIASDRFYQRLKSDYAVLSCGCPNGKSPLWKEYDLTNEPMFDFDKGWLLTSRWCVTHGEEYLNNLLSLDK